jgi:hypothetical protein
MILAAGALLGTLFFFSIAGTRVIDPSEYAWVMQLDWRIHFLGWHFFRREPWQWPPGRLEGYFHAPDGTAIGFTDSIPLMALLFKPWSPVLGDVFQYLGLWLLTCFALQGFFGVLIARLWTSSWMQQLLAASMFVLMPTLLVRVGHPALCAHFLLLWALWLYWRPEREALQVLHQAALGGVAGLVHPYLAVMVLALLAARAVRARSAAALAAAVLSVALGWWAAGLFTARGAEQLATEGLGYYSMNLLGPITPSGWSTLLPELPAATPGQRYEGFQYLGVGGLLLIGAAAAIAVRTRSLPWRSLTPLLAACVLCAAYALGPRITAADRPLVDLSGAVPDWLAVFRATGRFFWPMAYAGLMAAVATIARGTSRRRATAILVVAVALQLVDLHAAHAERWRTSRSEAFHSHRLPLVSPFWSTVLPHYRHMVLINPPQCGEAPISFEWPAFLAGRHGLTINAGEVARPDVDAVRAYCRELHERTREGAVRDDEIYLVHPRFVEPLQRVARSPLICVQVDGLWVCATEASAARWRSARHVPDGM